MEEKKSPNFALGFLIGLLLCVIIWYWQKSTAAEDGALALLDRYADMEKRWRQARQDWSSPPSQPPLSQPQPEETPESAFNLQQVKGIGPVFEEQLRLAGVTNLPKLTGMSAAQLAELLDIGSTRAANILAEAKKLG